MTGIVETRFVAEETHLAYCRRYIEEAYDACPTGCGVSFGELLCHELHTQQLTFVQLAEKWGISLATLGELIWDHCKRMEPVPTVNHAYPGKARPASSAAEEKTP
jgi:hypothetical protein